MRTSNQYLLQGLCTLLGNFIIVLFLVEVVKKGDLTSALHSTSFGAITFYVDRPYAARTRRINLAAREAP
jgi:hypothetical protein